MEKEPIKISLKIGISLSILVIIVIISMLTILFFKLNNTDKQIAKVDDWEFDAKKLSEERGSLYGVNSKSHVPASLTVDSAVASESINSGTIGFSTGGAKDINNFRENIKNGYFPISTDITYNGLFYDYTFDTGEKRESKDCFLQLIQQLYQKTQYQKKMNYI